MVLADFHGKCENWLNLFIEKCVPLFFTVIRLDLIGISGIFDRLNCILDACPPAFFIGFNKTGICSE